MAEDLKVANWRYGKPSMSSPGRFNLLVVFFCDMTMTLTLLPTHQEPCSTIGQSTW
jgi:hypothetical protein